MIYVAGPPLYIIRTKNDKIYIDDMDHFYRFSDDLMRAAFDLVIDNPKQKKLSKGVFNVYLNKLRGFPQFLENFASALAVKPIILENIIIYYNNIIHGDGKEFSKLYDEVRIKKNKTNVTIEINNGFEYYSILIDKGFHDSVYLPIFNKLTDIKLHNVVFKGKTDEALYGGSIYNNAIISNNILTSARGTTVTRMKGLGEMDAIDLEITVCDPETRFLTQVTMTDDIEHNAKWMDILMTDKYQDEKKALFN